MTTTCSDINQNNSSSDQITKVISFVKKFPINTPVFVTCFFENHGDVKMLLIPLYYLNSAFKCQVLAVDTPLLPKGHLSTTEQRNNINISIYDIKSWKLWKKEKGFLNFGNGFITEAYLKMIFN